MSWVPTSPSPHRYSVPQVGGRFKHRQEAIQAAHVVAQQRHQDGMIGLARVRPRFSKEFVVDKSGQVVT